MNLQKIKSHIIRFVQNNKILVVSMSILLTVLLFFSIKVESPASLNGMLHKGEKYSKEGKFALALNVYNIAVRKYPNSYEAHYRLGKLYSKVQEPEKSKIEYFRAISLGVPDRYEAQFAMADIYQREGNYPFAEQILKNLVGINNSHIVKEKLGKLYQAWGKKLFYKDKLASLDKYKLSYKYLRELNSRDLRITKKLLEKNYSSIAVILLRENREAEAIKLLESSISLFDNAEAHYKLGEIYEYKNTDRAIKEYEQAFKINPDIGSKIYFSNLLFAYGNSLKQKGDLQKAKEFYKKASYYSKRTSSSTSLPAQNVIVNLGATRYYEDVHKDTLIPGITFKIMNSGSKDIKYLKAKVIFWADNRILDKVVKDIASSSSILQADQSTESFNVFSTNSVSGIYSSHNIKIQIFISQSRPDKWKLYRSTCILIKKK